MASRSRPLLRVLLILVAVLSVSVPVGAQDGGAPLPENPYERLAEARRRQAEAALAIDALNASAVEVQHRLAQVEAWVDAQQQLVSAAQTELVTANLAAGRARTAEDAKATELAELEALMREIAIEAFIRPRQMEGLAVLVERDFDAAAKADVMLRAKSERDNRVADELSATESALRELRVVADEQARRSERVAEEAASALDELHRARLEQVALAERITVDLQTTTDEVLFLGGAEAEAALAVQRETEALLARVGRDAAVPLVDIRGFLVHADIGPAIEGLLADAERDGIELGGWGHRTTAQQVSLRRQHCGGEGVSDADAVYGMAPAACSPPTAKPGTSMHELGLAIDFTHGGATIASHSSPAFQWLAENAPVYGLHNLPSEPWHWSVNGD